MGRGQEGGWWLDMKQAAGQSSYEYLMSPHLTRPQGEAAKENTMTNILICILGMDAVGSPYLG